jgi:hypothetical protein
VRRTLVLALAAVVLAISGGSASASDWTRFGYDAQRSNAGPERTGIAVRDLRKLKRRRVRLPGTVDSSPIYLSRVKVAGRRRSGVFFATTSYGITLAIDARSRKILWKFTPRGMAAWEGSPQITQATPVADPDRRALYAAAPDGQVHKLSVASGRERAGWPRRVTADPTHEKLGSALNVSGPYLLVTVGSYLAEPRYQGRVLAIDRASGRVVHVFNSLCSDLQDQIFHPSACPFSNSGIWSRSGAVVMPGSKRILVGTGNGPFNGTTNWADSVLMLTPDASRLLQNYTPVNQAELEATDRDLGSSSPALLPQPGRGKPRYLFAAQGSKDFKVRLLSLDRLNGVSKTPGPQTGGELQTFGGSWVYSTAAVWRTDEGRVLLFSGDGQGSKGYEFRGNPLLLHLRWRNRNPGSSPVVAGGLVYVYDQYGGMVNVYRPISGHRVATLRAGPGHWNSPIVVGGRIALTEGDANKHRRSGILDIWTR